VRHVGAGGAILLEADADPDARRTVQASSVLGLVAGARPRGRLPTALRRLRLDLVEAWHARPDAGGGDSVRRKYDAQAGHYAATLPALDPGISDRLARGTARPGTILVAGCGAGSECLGLAALGWRVRGVDFSPAMVDHARRLAAANGAAVDFAVADLTVHDEAPGSFNAVLFTYDVYSFLPEAAGRVALLRRMARWLAPGGSILVSARLVRRPWERCILTLQWLVAGAPGIDRWGDSHTRYVDPDGTLRRSFVHYFTLHRLRREIRAAGLRPGRYHAGHLAAALPPSPIGREDQRR